MKIRKIEFKNNPVLGDLALDFTDADGKTVDTIILAGENGAGKSYLLDAIYNSTPRIINAHESSTELRSYEVEFNDAEMDVIKLIPEFSQRVNRPVKDNIFHFHINYSVTGNWGSTIIYVTLDNGSEVALNGALFNRNDSKKVLTTIFSDVEINFTPQEIASVTAKNIDEDNIRSQRSTTDIATDITQLLIDIQSNDALDLNTWVEKNPGVAPNLDNINRRMNRFANAFQFMFPNKRYKRIESKNGTKKIIFSEHGKEMEIKHLSSGEKQIVFRGGFLLKNKESAKGALILIDEPEISLHPRWQLKILTFFKQLFTGEEGQTSQIITATHSPFVIHNSNRRDDKVIVLQKDDDGKVSVQDTPTFYDWSNEKKVESAFNVSGILNPDHIAVFLEGETDEMYFRKAAEINGVDREKISFHWIGRLKENGQAEFTGDSALNHARTFFLANEHMRKGCIVLLYDNDTLKPEEDYDNLLIRKMSDQRNNEIFEIGIESLLFLYSGFERIEFYTESVKINKYGAKSVIRDLDKMKLAKHICNELDEEGQKEVLKGIEEEIFRLLG